MSAMSLAKLTSLSTQTLSLLLERQRLLSLPLPVVTPTSATPAQNLHLPQIARNLQQLRGGVRALEPSEASVLLRLQYTRMRDMLGDEAERSGVLPLEDNATAGAGDTGTDGSTKIEMHISSQGK